MSFTKYKRTNIAEMRPYIEGEDLTNISVSPVDTPAAGGMIARNPENHTDQWYVAERYFAENFGLASAAHAPVKGYKPMSPNQIATMNIIKGIGQNVGEVIETLADASASDLEIDHRFLAIAKTDLQKGFMALTRAVANPDFF